VFTVSNGDSNDAIFYWGAAVDTHPVAIPAGETVDLLFGGLATPVVAADGGGADGDACSIYMAAGDYANIFIAFWTSQD
jgi:hypothetical protein